MGEAAVMALALERGISFADAEEILYPAPSPKNQATHCPVCNKWFRGRKAVLMHAEAKHAKDKHAERLAAWKLEWVK